MTAKKRGRPRKNPQLFPPGAVRSFHPFEPLPVERLTDKDRTQIVAMIRARAAASPTLSFPLTLDPAKAGDPIPARPPSKELRNWLEAAAGALESGDASRASYYLIHALKARELDLLNAIGELAEIGKRKLTADKKRGPKAHVVRR